MIIRLLQADDNRSQFSCGHAKLDRFFRELAWQNQNRQGVSTTHVAIDGRILGFATIVAGTVQSAAASPLIQESVPKYPLPVLRLARMGVEQAFQKQGIGKSLLKHIFRIALEMREKVGCVGVLVDAKIEKRGYYEGLGFRPLAVIEGKGSLIGETVELFMPLELIKRATPGAEGR